MSKKYDYKDQELDLKMRIKFLEKKLREPDHGVEQYEEWQSNLEMVTDELTKLQFKKFKYFLGKWVHNFKEQNQLINVTDCMFASLAEDDQIDVATKWYHRVIKEKDIKHYQLLAKYTKEENEMLKKRLKVVQKERKKEVKRQIHDRLMQFRKKEVDFKKQKKEAIKQSKECIQKNFDSLLRQNVMELNRCRNKIFEQEKIINSYIEQKNELQNKILEFTEKQEVKQ